MATETTPEITEADLRTIAAQLDAGELDPESEVELKSEATTDQAETKPGGSVSPEKEVTQESQDQSQQAKEQAEIDYRAEYERLKKEEERKDRTWKRINEEKEALAKLRVTARPNETRIASEQFSAEEFEQYAEKLADEGNTQDARKAMTRAREIRRQAFVEKYQESVKEAIDDDPELANQESELAKVVSKLVSSDPSFGAVPTGFKNAVRLAKAEKLAASLPGLKGEIENYKKEIERLNKAMEIGGKPGLPKRDASKRFEDMDLKEQSAYLRSRAAEADDSYYG